jgi:predicted nucleic acid-binding protein
MRFWDASAVLPLCCQQPATDPLLRLLEADDEVVVCWATGIECAAALARLERDGAMSERDLQPARARLHALSERWSEVNATPAVRSLAGQLLRRHSLQAAEASQLAAALVWRAELPVDAPFVTLDARLHAAAAAEGFSVLP